jgi:hypothetical protein
MLPLKQPGRPLSASLTRQLGRGGLPPNPVALGFKINLFDGQFCLQAIHLKDQFLLNFTKAKKARLVPREGLTQRRIKIRKTKEKKQAQNQEEREENIYLKQLSK